MSVLTPVIHIPLVERERDPSVSTSEAITPPCRELVGGFGAGAGDTQEEEEEKGESDGGLVREGTAARGVEGGGVLTRVG